MSFEKTWYGDDVVLQALLDGWQPGKDYTFKPNKTVYARVLFFHHKWTRSQLMERLNIAPRMLAIMLRPDWDGITEEADAIQPDWKAAYEGSVIRERQWKTEVTHLRNQLDGVREYARQLAASHPGRRPQASVIGREILERIGL